MSSTRLWVLLPQVRVWWTPLRAFKVASLGIVTYCCFSWQHTKIHRIISGLTQWRWAFKAPFPASPARAFAILHVFLEPNTSSHYIFQRSASLYSQSIQFFQSPCSDAIPAAFQNKTCSVDAQCQPCTATEATRDTQVLEVRLVLEQNTLWEQKVINLQIWSDPCQDF